jgi:hypothetical protein
VSEGACSKYRGKCKGRSKSTATSELAERAEVKVSIVSCRHITAALVSLCRCVLAAMPLRMASATRSMRINTRTTASFAFTFVYAFAYALNPAIEGSSRVTVSPQRLLCSSVLVRPRSLFRDKKSKVFFDGDLEWQIPSLVDSSKMIHVTLARSAEAVDRWVNENCVADATAVGFDVEWKPTTHKLDVAMPTLIQLATGSSALLIQPFELSKGRLPTIDTFPRSFTSVLLDERVLKVGVGIYEDLLLVKSKYGVPFTGYWDIGKVFMS